MSIVGVSNNLLDKKVKCENGKEGTVLAVGVSKEGSFYLLLRLENGNLGRINSEEVTIID